MKQLIAILLVGFFVTQNSNAQNLEQKMMDQLGPCAETLWEEGEDYYTLKDAYAKNGYLSISGGWPTCGCGCNATVAAFRDAQKNYTFLRWEEWDCAQEFGSYSSRKMEDILPRDFSLNAFVSEDRKAIEFNAKSYFYLELELPIHGTDIPVKLKPLPLGMLGNSKNGMVYNTQSVEVTDHAAANLRKIANTLETEAQLNLLKTNSLEKLPTGLQEQINKILKQHYEYTWDAFYLLLMQSYDAYLIYNQLDYEEAVLGWDRENARFFLKSKAKKTVKKTFLEFLRTAKTYEIIC